MTDPVLRLVVFGTPGTAGSKSAFPLWRTDKATGQRHFVRTMQVEKDLHNVKANWRTQIMAAAAEQIRCPCPELDCTKLLDPFPLDEALAAACVFTVKKPADAPKRSRSWPAVSPDLSKYIRAAEDALQAAGVISNDGRIVEYRRLAKCYPNEDPDALAVPGMVFTLWRMVDLSGWQRDAVLAPAADTLFDPLSPPGVGDIQGPGAREGAGAA
jgi:hypothetical protein